MGCNDRSFCSTNAKCASSNIRRSTTTTHRARKQQQKRLMNVMHRSRNFKNRSTNSATCLPYYLLTELFSNLIAVRVLDIFIFVLSGLYAQSLYAHILCRAYMPRAYMPRAYMLTFHI